MAHWAWDPSSHPWGRPPFAEEIFEECPLLKLLWKSFNRQVSCSRLELASEMMRSLWTATKEVGAEQERAQLWTNKRLCHYFCSELRVNTFHNQMRTRPAHMDTGSFLLRVCICLRWMQPQRRPASSLAASFLSHLSICRWFSCSPFSHSFLSHSAAA